MQLSCLQENLSRGLSIVQRAVATRTTLPITQNVMMATDNARLKLSATNLEIAISTWVGAQVEEEGSLTVPARLLTEFINSLPGGANRRHLICLNRSAWASNAPAIRGPYQWAGRRRLSTHSNR